MWNNLTKETAVSKFLSMHIYPPAGYALALRGGVGSIFRNARGSLNMASA
jgi:hypothetical protein